MLGGTGWLRGLGEQWRRAVGTRDTETSVEAEVPRRAQEGRACE